MTKSKRILPPRQPWTEDQLELLRTRYPDGRTCVIALEIGRNIYSVYNKAYALGLKKSVAFLASPEAGRTDGKRGGASRFKKGLVPWNKGIKGLQIGGAATQFKTGHRPHTWRPIGSERLTKDGYLQRKVTDTGYVPRDWVGIHILLWIEHHGALPKGHAVVFKDGNKTHIDIGNLELLSRAELMRRNTRHNLPKELSDLIQLRGALNRVINHRTKNEQ